MFFSSGSDSKQEASVLILFLQQTSNTLTTHHTGHYRLRTHSNAAVSHTLLSESDGEDKMVLFSKREYAYIILIDANRNKQLLNPRTVHSICHQQ